MRKYDELSDREMREVLYLVDDKKYDYDEVYNEILKIASRELCPNCREPVGDCACMRNKCCECGEPVGNITFTVCDKCWDKPREPKKIEKLQQSGIDMCWDSKIEKINELVDAYNALSDRCDKGSE